MRSGLITVLEGGTPAATPLSIHDWNIGAVSSADVRSTLARPEWSELLDLGLLVSHHCEIVCG